MLVLLTEFVIQLHNTPNSAAEQPVILGHILCCNRDILDPKIREVSLIAVIFDVQFYSEPVNYCETASFA